MNWGFIGFGRIAIKFLESLKHAEGQVPFALASRSNAETLRAQYPDIKVYNNYDDLLKDPDVEVVYVNTTNNLHRENAIDALRAGKHVLCEKPLSLSVNEVEEIIRVAKQENRFLMEGIWSRFLPAYQLAKAVIDSGEIGEIKLIRSEFAFTDVSHKARLYDPALAGGSNYDINIYNLALVHDIFGHAAPDIVVQANKSATGTDVSCSSLLQYPDKQLAQLFSSITMTCDNSAFIYGTLGWVSMQHFWMSESFEVHTEAGTRKVNAPFTSNGYYHEIMEAVSCIKSGKLESSLMTHCHSTELASLVEKTENLIKAI